MIVSNIQRSKVMLWIIVLLSIIGLLGFPLIQWLFRFIVKLLFLFSKGLAVIGFVGLLSLIGFKGLIVLIWALVIIFIVFTIRISAKIYRKIIRLK